MTPVDIGAEFIRLRLSLPELRADSGRFAFPDLPDGDLQTRPVWPQYVLLRDAVFPEPDHTNTHLRVENDQLLIEQPMRHACYRFLGYDSSNEAFVAEFVGAS